MSAFSPQGQDAYNVADRGDIENVINYININTHDYLIKLNAYFDCLSQFYNMSKTDHLQRDACISVIKSKIYILSKDEDLQNIILQTIRSPRIVENDNLRETVRKVEYLTKKSYCSRNSWDCGLRNTKFSHHLSNIYGHLGTAQATAGQSLFATAATGLIASGAAVVATNPGTVGFALGMPIICFGGAIIAGAIISAALAAKRDDP